MSRKKSDLVALLREAAALMQIAGENPFHAKAFETGAAAVAELEGAPEDWPDSGVLLRTKGIGKGLRERIEEWIATGTIASVETLRAEIPPGLLVMSRIPGLGTKSILTLWKDLQIDTIDKLETAAREGKLTPLPRFGEKLVQRILAGIDQTRKYGTRHLISQARRTAAEIFEQLKQLEGVQRIEACGSLRRRRETIGDLDFIVTTTNPALAMQTFTTLSGVETVVAHGPTKSSILLQGGVEVDLRVVEDSQFAAAVNYFTGSKEHNTALRGRAKRRGMRLNEYGLYREGEEQPLPAAEEADIYLHLGLAYVEPELRENMGEIEAAEAGTLPKLITRDAMRGMLHCHSTWSDGKNSIEEMAQAARALGYEYFALCDHSRLAAYAGGLSIERVRQQGEAIDALNKQFKGFKILKGIECDILADGTLDYPDDLLAELDIVGISIHSGFGMDREAMTQRICRAMEHPAARILAHPTGRLLLKREPYAVDLDAVIATAARTGTVIEINANPRRLDLDWRYLKQAKAAGCRFAVNPDAHSIPELDYVEHGLGVARKGWLEPADVSNTMTRKQFTAWLKAGKHP